MAQGAYFNFELIGGAELDKALMMIEDVGTQKNVLKAAMRKALKPVAERARQLVPVDDGDLRDSIVVSPSITKTQRKFAERTGQPTMYVGTAWPTAHLVEFGTGPRQV
ncbi:MAG: HK97 gp10 family phage protein, partial [Candidatus Marinimicrobia bacterium]|nr:HK97 gp10 family phage protein [Candidatus Neomarinimicrobiota bacterium]